MNEKKYIPRLVDKKIEDYLSVIGAICIEGPKWCGKTETAKQHSKSIISLDDENTREQIEFDVNSAFFTNEEELPELIDEWHLVPQIWDATRREVDKRNRKGNFILTGSTTLNKKNKQKIKHSGAGRIAKINMYTMSLYESGDSTGQASITDMLNQTQKSLALKKTDIKDIAKYIVRGGWPENINVPEDKVNLIPKSYIESLLDTDMNEEDKIRDRNKMLMLLKSLARNESTIVSNNTIMSDMMENKESIANKITLADYLDVLDRLHIIQNEPAYSINYRSSKRVGKSPKRHLVDPSLSCACLNLNVAKLMSDLKTFGFMFESLVTRDLKIYADFLDAELYHFRDNSTGDEVDAIMEFSDGEYAAFEIKLGYNKIDEALKSLERFYNGVSKKPKFMCVIVGNAQGIAYDKDKNTYIVPITALKP